MKLSFMNGEEKPLNPKTKQKGTGLDDNRILLFVDFSQPFHSNSET